MYLDIISGCVFGCIFNNFFFCSTNFLNSNVKKIEFLFDSLKKNNQNSKNSNWPPLRSEVIVTPTSYIPYERSLPDKNYEIKIFSKQFQMWK